MSSHVEGPLLRRSIPFVENWIADLVAARAPPPAAANAKVNETKAVKKEGKKSAAPSAAADSTATSMSRCHFVVGKVLEVSPHPESQKLYIEKIDIGEEGRTRTILSGLQEYVKQEEFVNRLVLVIANLEPRKLAGVFSEGMVLCASRSEGESRALELLDIPEGTPVGERVVFEGHEGPHEPVLKKKLAKHFEEVARDLRTNDKGEVVWKEMPFRTTKGCITASLANAVVS